MACLTVYVASQSLVSSSSDATLGSVDRGGLGVLLGGLGFLVGLGVLLRAGLEVDIVTGGDLVSVGFCWITGCRA